MQVLKYTKKTSSKIDMVEKAVQIHCVINDMKLSKTSTSVLAYFIVYGVNKKTIDLINRSNIFKHKGSLSNILYNLRKRKLIIKEEIGPDSFPKGLNFLVEDKLGLIIKLENK